MKWNRRGNLAQRNAAPPAINGKQSPTHLHLPLLLSFSSNISHISAFRSLSHNQYFIWSYQNSERINHPKQGHQACQGKGFPCQRLIRNHWPGPGVPVEMRQDVYGNEGKCLWVVFTWWHTIWWAHHTKACHLLTGLSYRSTGLPSLELLASPLALLRNSGPASISSWRRASRLSIPATPTTLMKQTTQTMKNRWNSISVATHMVMWRRRQPPSLDFYWFHMNLFFNFSHSMFLGCTLMCPSVLCVWEQHLCGDVCDAPRFFSFSRLNPMIQFSKKPFKISIPVRKVLITSEQEINVWTVQSDVEVVDV